MKRAVNILNSRLAEGDKQKQVTAQELRNKDQQIQKLQETIKQLSILMHGNCRMTMNGKGDQYDRPDVY